MVTLKINAVGVCSKVPGHSHAPLADNRSARIIRARRLVTSAAICHECTVSNVYRFAGSVGSGIASPATALATYSARQQPCRLNLRRCHEKSKSERLRLMLSAPHRRQGAALQNNPRFLSRLRNDGWLIIN